MRRRTIPSSRRRRRSSTWACEACEAYDRADLDRPADHRTPGAGRPDRPHRRRRRVQAGQELPGQRAGRGDRLPGRRRRGDRAADVRALRREPRRPTCSTTATRRAASPSPWTTCAAMWSRAARTGRRPTRPGRRAWRSTCRASCSPAAWSWWTRPGSAGSARRTPRPASPRSRWPTRCVFVTDASQELTRSELDFVQQARRTVPHRRLRPHQDRLLPGLAADPRPRRGPSAAPVADVPLMAVSSSLRSLAVKTNDTDAQHRVRLRRPGPVRHRPGRRRRRPTRSRQTRRPR